MFIAAWLKNGGILRAAPFFFSSLFLCALFILLSACATKLGKDGKTESDVNLRYLAKSDIDRMVDTSYAEIMEGLRRIAEKLYRRNPHEWKKVGQPSLETAVAHLFNDSLDFPELQGFKEGDAVLFAFNAHYQGDRVRAFMAGLIGMSKASFANKADFYVLDGLNEQMLYNCARNFEIAVWKLSSSRDAEGKIILISNELDATNPNLSFEREFGRMIGLLDLQSKVVADKHGRAISRITQNIASLLFLPVSALGLK